MNLQKLTPPLSGLKLRDEIDIPRYLSMRYMPYLYCLPLEIHGLTFIDYQLNLHNLLGGPLAIYNNHYDRHNGTFYCDSNALTTLEGSPIFIKGDFYCFKNNLSNLIGGPLYVHGRYSCIGNPLTSLEGLPLYIGNGLALTIYPNSPLANITHDEIRTYIQSICTVIGVIEITNYI